MHTTELFEHAWTGEISAPLRLVENRVRPDWVDEFGHLNMAHYLTICDQANWSFWNWVNHPAPLAGRQGHEYVIVENHVLYTGELAEGAAFAIETQLTELDDKRLILFHRVLDAEGGLAAANETKLLGFNLETRGIERWQPSVMERLEAVQAAHAPLGTPEQAGRAIALKQR
ncbi:MAG: thioesterase family protein [Pseudomonadota bacterium]